MVGVAYNETFVNHFDAEISKYAMHASAVWQKAVWRIWIVKELLLNLIH